MESNVQKMREALMFAEHVLSFVAQNVRGETGMVIGSDYSKAAIRCRDALSLPIRNCDVGTPEERLHRYHNLCREISERHERIGERAPLTAFPTAFEWEDRPYEEGGAS